MTETRTYTVRYTVEADDAEEATEKALAGDTVDEEEIKLLEVIDRDLDTDPEPIH